MGNLNIVVERFILLTCCLFVMVCVLHPLVRSSLFPLHINIRLQNHNCQQFLIKKKKHSMRCWIWKADKEKEIILCQNQKSKNK